MHGGIFQACWSLTETLRVGECMTGTGGDGGPAARGAAPVSHAPFCPHVDEWIL